MEPLDHCDYLGQLMLSIAKPWEMCIVEMLCRCVTVLCVCADPCIRFVLGVSVRCDVC